MYIFRAYKKLPRVFLSRYLVFLFLQKITNHFFSEVVEERIMNTKSNSKQHCQICEKVFKTSNMQWHIKNVHGERPDKIFKCVICNKVYSNPRELGRHTNSIHENKKSHVCTSCGKKFPQVGVLKRHIQTVHDSHKQRKCESCGKSFSEAGSLKRHNHIVHEGHKVLEL